MAKRVIIVGAGWSGLAAAKTYLQIDPDIDIKILDSDSSVGGVWSGSRVYPGLIADSPVGLFEFSDKTMVDGEHPPYGTITGAGVHQYLQKYAENAQILHRIQFNTRVSSVYREGEGWRVNTEQGDTLDCEKLILATGLDSEPNWPDVPNNGFKGPVMHSVSLGTEHHRLTDPGIESVAVLGGCKSAIEAANICLNAGKKVCWVIRENGNGVGTLILLNHNSKINVGAINNSRLFSSLSPSIFNARGFWYSFLHSGKWKWGSALLRKFWSAASRAAHGAPEYEKSSNGIKIRPEILKEGLRWTTASVSVLPWDTKFLPALHAEKELLVHRATPTSLSKDGMHLSSGALLPVSAVVYATGWDHSKSLFTPSETLDLGLPIPLSAEPGAVAARWNDLYSVADVQVCSLFPDLASPPPHVIKEPTHTPYRLHRQIISPNLLSRRDRSVVALGLTSSSQTATCSELSALWAVAWMEDLMPPSFPPSKEDLEMDVAMVNCWMWRRYLSSRGNGLPIIATEIQTVFDSLMRDMGLRAQRRRRGILGILREYLTPYKAADYRGVVEELLERVRKEREKGDVAKKRV